MADVVLACELNVGYVSREEVSRFRLQYTEKIPNHPFYCVIIFKDLCLKILLYEVCLYHIKSLFTYGILLSLWKFCLCKVVLYVMII